MLSNGRYIIEGSKEKLNGKVKISGAKNSTLPIMCATLLTEGEVTLINVPNLNDVHILKKLLENLGAKNSLENGVFITKKIDKKLLKSEIEKYYSDKIRYSVLLLGVMLAKNKKIKMYQPGGCDLGGRPIDIHITSLEKMGATFTQEGDYIVAKTEGLKGAQIELRFPSVGATENIIIAAALAEGKTVIKNAAREPEIDDLCNFINSMGGKISGIGTKTIEIIGVKELKGTTHRIIPDRIETATFLSVAAITNSEIIIENTKVEYLFEIMRVYQELGCKIEVLNPETIKIKGTDKLQNYFVKTDVYPGLPTDVQPVLCPVLTLASGRSKVIDTIYPKRFGVANEMEKMGTKVEYDNVNSATFEGVKLLTGAEVMSTDLRSGAGLILAGLVAEGKTVVTNAYQVNRGYENFAEKLRGLGAKVIYEE